MRILFASAEFAPLVRTGGLGDAVAGLAQAVASYGHDVAVAIPGYGASPRRGPEPEWRSSARGNVEVLEWVDDDFARPGIYGPQPGTAYEDNWRRFGAFSRAVAELAPSFDLVHGHDAHVGLALLLSEVPSVFTIHNASYPMLGPLDEVRALTGIAPEHRDSLCTSIRTG